MLLSEAFEAYEIDILISENKSDSCIDNYRCTLNSFLRSNEDVDIALLSYIHIIQWKKSMHCDDNSTVYQAQNLRNIRSILYYIKSHGFSSLDPSEITLPKGEYKKTGWLNSQEMYLFLKAIDDGANNSIRAKQSYIRDKALFSLQFSSGARINEILSLNRGDIKNKSATVKGKGRTHTLDTLLFDDNALEALDTYLSTRKDNLAPMFLSRENKRPHVSTIIQSFHRYIKLAGIELNGRGATHVLRHSFITDLDLKGLDINNIKRQARHTKSTDTENYIHSGDMNRRKIYDKAHTKTPI